MRYLLDTSVIISYLRGKQEVVDKINSLEGELTSSFICLAELYEGIATVKDGKKAERGVLDFFSGLSSTYGLDEESSRHFGMIRANLRKKGKMIDDLDIILAAIARANNLTIVTSNSKHFSVVDDLDILSLPS